MHRTCALLLIVLLNAARAFGQPVPGTVAGEQLVIGASTQSDLNTTAVATIFSLPARTAGQELVGVNATGRELVKGLLGTADIPSVFTRRDVVETVPNKWNFSSGLTVGSTLSGGSGLLTIDTPTRISGTDPYVSLFESDGGTDRKHWIWRSGGEQTAVEAWNDALSTSTTLWRGYRRTSSDQYGALGTAQTFELGSTVRNLWPATSDILQMGASNRWISALFVSELVAQYFTPIETQVIYGGSSIHARGSKLTRALTTSATTLFVKHSSFRYLDYLVLKGLTANGTAQAEYVQINQAGAYDCTEGDADEVAGNGVVTLPASCGGIDLNDYGIDVVRNKDGSGIGANAWEAGSAVSATDRMLTLDAWNSPVISYGGAVIGNGAAAYWNFDSNTSPTPNRIGASGGDVTVASGASTNGGGGFTGATGTSGNGGWFRTTDGKGFEAASVPALNVASAGCALSVEFVYFVNGTTPGAATTQRIVTKWDETNANTINFIIEHYGSGSGANNGKMTMIGWNPSGAGSLFNMGPVVTPTAGWHHFVFTYSNVNGGRVYIDSVLTGTPSAPNGCATFNSNPVRGYLWGTNGNALGAHISELAIYVNELSALQVASTYKLLTTNRAGLQVGPTAAGRVRTSDTNWYDISTRWALGNLIGHYDYQREIYGFVAGDYTADWIAADPTNGYRIMSGTVTKFQAVGGSLSLTGDLSIGTSGSLRSGATAYDTTTGYWLDYNSGSPRFRIGTTSAGTSYLRWTGSALEMKSSTLSVDTNGITMTPNAVANYASPYGYKFSSSIGSSEVGVFGYEEAGGRSLALLNRAVSPGRLVQSLISATGAGGSATVRVFDDNAGGNGAEFLTPDASLRLQDATLSIGGVSTLQINGFSTFTGVCTGTITVEKGLIRSC